MTTPNGSGTIAYAEHKSLVDGGRARLVCLVREFGWVVQDFGRLMSYG